MTLLRRLSAILAHTPLPASQLATGFGSGLKPLLPSAVAAAAAPQQQCSSLVGFFQARLLSSSSSSLGGLKALAAGAAAAAAALPATQLQLARGFASKIRPRFLGCKLKPYSSYKERFKMTGSGKIRYMRPGSVHKHFNKGNRQNRDLAKTQVLYETYAKTMRKLGFTMRSF